MTDSMDRAVQLELYSARNRQPVQLGKARCAMDKVIQAEHNNIIIIIHTFLSCHKVITSEVVAAQVRLCHYCPLL